MTSAEEDCVSPRVGGIPTTTDPAGYVLLARYAYAGVGKLQAITDANGNTWRYVQAGRHREVWREAPSVSLATSASVDATLVAAATTRSRGGCTSTTCASGGWPSCCSPSTRSGPTGRYGRGDRTSSAGMVSVQGA